MKNAKLADILNYQTIIFDCDGVLVDSNVVKGQVFYDVAKKYGEPIAKTFYNYYMENAGISRFEKLRYLHEDLLSGKHLEKKESDLQEIKEILAQRIHDYVLTTDTVDFLQSLKNHNIKLFVSSGTEEQELIKLLQVKKIDHFFVDIYGSPDKKDVHVKKVKEKVGENSILFVGDSQSDYEVSHRTQLDFMFMSSYSEFKEWENFFAKKDIYHIKSFADLMERPTP